MIKSKKAFLSIASAVALFLCSCKTAKLCLKPDPEKRIESKVTSSPNDYLGQIIVYRKWLFFRAGSPASTFSFVSPNVLVTAGHTLRNRFLRSHVVMIRINVGQICVNNAPVFLQTETYKKNQLKIFMNKAFQKNGSAENDYSFAALPQNIAAHYFHVTNLDNHSAAGDSVFISGYPGDKGKDADKGRELWVKGDIKANLIISDNLILYSIYTHEGDSGAPIWMKSEGIPVLMGVHGTGNYKRGYCNAGIKFNSERLTELSDFIKTNSIP